MLHKSPWILAAAVLIIAGLFAILNPFSSEMKAESTAFSWGLEQFLGWLFFGTGAVCAFFGYRSDPRNITAMIIGGLSALMGAFLLVDPAGSSSFLRILIAFCLLGSGAVKVVAGTKLSSRNLRLAYFVTGGLSAFIALVVLLGELSPNLTEIAALLALDLIANGVLMFFWVAQENNDKLRQ